MNYYIKAFIIFFITVIGISSATGQIDFGAYYTNLIKDLSWEAYSRTGDHPDVVLQLSKPEGQMVFWRGNSYLPYWKTVRGQWNLTEIVTRTGDGINPMHDRNNVYSNVRIIENTSRKVVIHWRYLASFTRGNPHRDVNPNNFTDEVFTITNSHLFWPFSSQQRGKISYNEKLLLEGMTDQPAASLTGLARSWLSAPEVLSVSGGRSQGYNQSHRAYCFIAESPRFSFSIDASEGKPINNLCFEIRNWGKSESAGLVVDGREWKTGPDFRQGKIIDTDGT